MKKTRLYMQIGQIATCLAATAMSFMAILTDLEMQYSLSFLGIAIVLAIINFVLLIITLKKERGEE